MFVERFMAWSAQAGSTQRSMAVCQLAQSYLDEAVAVADVQATEKVFTLYLQDSDMRVRADLADILAGSTHLPRAIIWGFLQDARDVALPFYASCSQLGEGELLHGVQQGEEAIQEAIAERPDMSDEIVRWLALHGEEAGVIALLKNETIRLCGGLLHDVAERMGDKPEVRAALLAHGNLSSATRQILAQGLGSALALLVSERGWNDRPAFAQTVSDSINRVNLSIAEETEADEMADYVNHLIATEQMSGGLLLRALCRREFSFLERAFSQLSGLSMARVASILANKRKASFKPLFKRTGLAPSYYALFAAGIEALNEEESNEAVLTAVMVAAENQPKTDGSIYALLGRMAGEMQQEAAQHFERQLYLEAA